MYDAPHFVLKKRESMFHKNRIDPVKTKRKEKFGIFTHLTNDYWTHICQAVYQAVEVGKNM